MEANRESFFESILLAMAQQGQMACHLLRPFQVVVCIKVSKKTKRGYHVRWWLLPFAANELESARAIDQKANRVGSKKDP